MYHILIESTELLRYAEESSVHNSKVEKKLGINLLC